jgi:hypothetical protein
MAHCGGYLADIDPQGFLVFANERGYAEYISAQEFASLLGQTVGAAHNNPTAGIRLVILSACRSAVARGGESVFNGVAQRLVDAWVPSVVAMQFSIRADKAAEFTAQLYRGLTRGDALVDALSWGRTALGVEGDQWYRPVLYLRWAENDGGQLFGSAASGAVSQGLSVLSGLLEVSNVQPPVGPAFRATFRAAREQIEVMGYYKALHDQLHTLQIGWYPSIVQAARRFPGDDADRDWFSQLEIDFQEIVSTVRKVAGTEIEETKKVAWIPDLVQAQQELHGAIENADLEQLRKALWRVNRVLSTQPALINQCLKNAAEALHLHDLETTLESIRNSLSARLDVTPQKLAQFGDGVTALLSINHNLSALIQEHDIWQEIDLELRRIEANMESNPSDLEWSWPDLKVKAGPLYNVIVADWAHSLKADEEDLDKAISTQNPTQVKHCFQRYRRRAAARFYQVDLDLHGFCGELRTVGEQLDAVLAVIQ